MATDSSKSGEHPLYCRDATGKYPLGYAMRPLNHLLPPMSYITNQRFAEPAGPSLNDLYCLENVFRKMATLSWPWYLWCGLNEGITNYPRMHLEGVRGEQYRWTTRLDVNHFSPSELSVKTKDGFLEISGKHGERRDTHGSISRSFTRKYKIPIGIDSENIRSTLSCDGILSVEAPLTPPPHRIIPVQFEKEPLMTGMKNRKDPRTDEASNEGINVQREGEREEESEGEREGERQGSEVGSLMDSTEMASSESPERPMQTNREADNDRSRDRQEHRTSAHGSDIPGSLTSPEGRSEAGGVIDERHGEKETVAKADEEQGEEEEEKREEERSGEEKLSRDETTSMDGRDQFVDLSEAATTHREAEERHEGDLQSEGTSGEEVVGEEALDCGQLQQLMIPQQEVLESLLSLDQEAI